jgi:hypothetical protein
VVDSIFLSRTSNEWNLIGVFECFVEWFVSMFSIYYTFYHLKCLFFINRSVLKVLKTIILINVMETSEDVDEYISGSKLNIDKFIRNNEYRRAFGLLILFLERLDGKEKAEVIDYYSKNMIDLGNFKNTFPSR